MQLCNSHSMNAHQFKNVPEFQGQQQHIALTTYHQMHVKQQEHLQLSKFLFIELPVIKLR